MPVVFSRNGSVRTFSVDVLSKNSKQMPDLLGFGTACGFPASSENGREDRRSVMWYNNAAVMTIKIRIIQTIIATSKVFDVTNPSQSAKLNETFSNQKDKS